MFAQLNSAGSRRQARVLFLSLVLHAALFVWLLRSPGPRLLMPFSVAVGHNGKVATKLYWPSRFPDDSSTSSSDSASQSYRRERLSHQELIWKQPPAAAKRPLPTVRTPGEDDSKSATLSKLGHGAPAGLPYGSLPGGPIYGDEIRPALPVTTADPVAYPWELPSAEGRVVVEITIDERGEIIRKTVLESLGSKLDEKVLAALNNWHFHPATRNGAAIASKQDAIFQFHARG